jgi:hypothetical protein
MSLGHAERRDVEADKWERCFVCGLVVPETAIVNGIRLHSPAPDCYGHFFLVQEIEAEGTVIPNVKERTQ